MRVERVESTERFAALAEAWGGLFERSAWRHVFLSHGFLTSWWHWLRRDASLSIVGVWQDDALLAALPLMRTRSRYAGRPVRSLELIGSGWGYGGALYDAGRPEALQAALAALASSGDWQILRLGKLAAPPPAFAARLDAVFPAASFPRETSRTQVPCIPLALGWEDYLAGRSASYRRNVRNREKRLAGSGSPRFVDVAGGSAPAVGDEQLLQWMTEIAGRSWKAAAGTAIVSKPEVLGYFSELVGALRAQDALEACVLLLDDTPIAYVLAARDEQALFEIDICYDEAHAACSPGKLARHHLLRRHFGGRLERYDFVDYYDHKLELASELRDVVSHSIVASSAYPRLLHWAKCRLAAVGVGSRA